MRVLVCEYVTGGGLLDQPLSGSLLREGELMLSALLQDLAELDGVEVVVSRDPRLPPPEAAVEVRWLAPGDDPWVAWDALMDAADAVWPVAPESDGILEYLSRLVVSRDKLLLGCRPEAIGVAASKLRTARLLEAFDIPVVPTFAAEEPLPAGGGQWVAKPDDGCGAEGLRLFANQAELLAWCAGAATRGLVVQPFTAGQALSLSLLCADGEAWLLSCNLQRVACINDRLRFLGAVVNGYAGERGPLAAIASAVAAALPGLWGYVGVDLVAGRDGPRVLEVNPRLTTSYAGLRRSLGYNPAARVLELLDGVGTRLPLGGVLSVDVDVDTLYVP